MIPHFNVSRSPKSLLTLRARRRSTTGDRESGQSFEFVACCVGRCSPSTQTLSSSVSRVVLWTASRERWVTAYSVGADVQLTSLRTTVSQQSCSLVQELAEYLGPAFDPSAELLLPTLGKMACVSFLCSPN